MVYTLVGLSRVLMILLAVISLARECTYETFQQLSASSSLEPNAIPESVMFEALVRCLRALESAAAGSDDEEQLKSATQEMPGKVDLVRADVGDAMRLVLVFPCYEFWQQTHAFEMQLVPAQARLLALASELNETKQALTAVRAKLDASEVRCALAETECGQLRSLVQGYQTKEEQRRETLADALQQQQQTHLQLQQIQDAKLCAAQAQVQLLQRQQQQQQQQQPISSPRKLVGVRGKRDARSFYARSGWLATSSASVPLEPSPDRSLAWDVVLETAERYFQVLDDAAHTVRVLRTGSYQLNLNVAHANAVALCVCVKRSANRDAASMRFEPTLVQVYDNKQRVSRIDRVLELWADDEVSVHLTERAVPRHPFRWLPHFAPQPNLLLLTFLDHDLIYKEAAQA